MAELSAVQRPISTLPIAAKISVPGSPDWVGIGADSVWMPFVRGTLPARFLPAAPVRSFDELVPAPAVPRPPAKCGSLTCLPFQSEFALSTAFAIRCRTRLR